MLIAAALTLPAPVTSAEPGHPFAAATFAPADVDLFVHVDDLASLRVELDGRPIDRWLHALVDDGEAARAWHGLAAAVAVDPAALFDLAFGRDVTFVRRRIDGGEVAEWTIVTTVDPTRARMIERRIKARFIEPRAGLAVLEWPEHAVLLARRGETLVVGPRTRPKLFHEVVDRIGNARQPDALVSSEAIERGRALGDGSVGLFARHRPPLGGWSVLVADLDGDVARIRQDGSFDSPPFERRVTRRTCSFAPVNVLEDRCLAVVLEPTDVGDGPLEAFVVTLLGEHLTSETMRRNLGDLRIIAVGEEEGRRRGEPVDALAPTVALCLKAEDACDALQHLDDRMVRLAGQLNRVAEGAPVDRGDASPPSVDWPADRRRQLDISAVASLLPGGEPVMGNVTLNWDVAEGPHGAWYVIASHPEVLSDVVTSLRRAPADQQNEIVGSFDSVGTADGRRIARHLASWAARSDLLAEPGEEGALRDTLELLSLWSDGIERCCWKLARPTPKSMRLELRVKLSPRESSEP